MAKSDEQMKRIRASLISKQEQLAMSEKAKRLREQKKYGKQVQQEVLKRRQEEKKKFNESVKNLRKKGKNVNIDEELEFLTEADGTADSSRNKRSKTADTAQKGLKK